MASLEESRPRPAKPPIMQPSNERVCFDVRRHGVVLVRPFLWSTALLAIAGLFLLAMPWPVPIVAPLVIGIGA